MNGIKPLGEHLADVEARGSEVRRRATREARAMRTEDRDFLGRAADAIARHYQGVPVERSFTDASGAVFDAVPVETQPGFRRSGEASPAKPAGLPGSGEARRTARGFAGGTDGFGNPQGAPRGAVPMRRETLEEAELWRGHRKSAPLDPGAAAGAEPSTPADPLPAGTNQHRYVWTQMGVGTLNRGGYAHHSAHRVPIDAAKDQWFSLTQQWYTRGAQHWEQGVPLTDPKMTVELGIHNMPRVFGTPGPTLWVGSTNNGYNHGAAEGGFHYNLRPGSGFVQTNPDWGLGMDLSPFSALGGPQYVLGFGAHLEGDRWWVYVAGGTADDAVGYWPASWWALNPAMAQASDKPQWGTETSTNALADGTIHYPPIGSGAPAADGWRRAAYIRDLIYYGDDGVARAVPAMTSVASIADLLPGQATSRHTPDIGYTGSSRFYAAPWGRTLWYGGPGAVLDSNTGVITVNPSPP